MDTLGPEILCNFCDEAPAVLFCHDCNMHFCTANGCDDQIHAGRRHKKEAIQGGTAATSLEEEAPICEFCELSASELYCEDCCMYLCTANGCLASVHKNAVGHEITSLFMDEDGSDYDEEQEGPSQLRSQSRYSEEGDLEPELSRLSMRSERSERSVAADKTPTSSKVEAPKREPPKPPTPASKPASPASDLPRSLSTPAKSPTKGRAPPTPAASPAAKVSAKKIVSNVVKRLVAPIKGTGTKEERLQRKESILAARQEPVKLPPTTFGSKFAPDDVKGRRKPSLTFLKQPSASRLNTSAPPASVSTTMRPPAPRTPSSTETKRGGGDIVITSVTTIRTTTTIRADPKPKPAATPPITRTRSSSNSSVASQASVRGSDLPPSITRVVSDKNASPAASLPSSLFSPSSALPSPTASSIRAPVRRASIVSNVSASPTSRLASTSSFSSVSSTASSSGVSGRRSSNISSGGEAEFEYPTGLAPLGLKYVNAAEAGVLIRGVTPGEAGDKAGIQAGDVVKLLNRKAVRNMADFQSILGDLKAATVYKIAVVRKDKSVDLKLAL